MLQIAARTYLGEKNYSEAFSHYISAEDSIGVGHVVDQVLEEYILHGTRPSFTVWPSN